MAITIHKKYFINHNLSNPLFLIFISSVLYFIKKINNENSANAAVIIANGINIDECIDVFDKILIDDGWCRVVHQSTENLIIGTLITPKIATRTQSPLINCNEGLF